MVTRNNIQRPKFNLQKLGRVRKQALKSNPSSYKSIVSTNIQHVRRISKKKAQQKDKVLKHMLDHALVKAGGVREASMKGKRLPAFSSLVYLDGGFKRRLYNQGTIFDVDSVSITYHVPYCLHGSIEAAPIKEEVVVVKAVPSGPGTTLGAPSGRDHGS